MRILIVGAGALGGFFGARLLAAGRDVTFLVRPHSAALLAGNGLRLTTPTETLTLPPPPTLSAQQLDQPYGLILLSCKAYDLAGAMDAFAPAVGHPGVHPTAILPLLNGMAHMDALDLRFGREHILGGATDVSASRDATGGIHHLNNLDSLFFGDRDDPDGPRVHRLAETLTVPGFRAVLRPVILQEMWQKWSGISTAVSATALMRAAIGDIVAAGAAHLIPELLAETSSVARAEGFPPAQSYLDTTIAKFTRAGSTFTTSLLRDLEVNRPIESHQILGDLLARARAHGLATPLLALAHAHLRCYEERRKREERHARDTQAG
jgi:2-dehydropantoate 2-reductase